jgi:hypothetical protein
MQPNRWALAAIWAVFSTAAPAAASPKPTTQILQIEPVDATAKRDALARAVFGAMMKQDLQGYLALHISYAEESKYERLRKSEAYYLKRRKRRFERLLERMRADGVDFAQAKIIAISRRSPPRAFKDIVLIGDIEVVFESAGRRFMLLLDDVLVIERGWVIGDRIKWPGPIDAR